ncbi:unnamed protein product [Allacma fusca]|uniref:F-box domain-containing protein n=1 Tax=Allacma fusca TaxID=39272 RepID=A0A8J2KDE6_9HEXA|nr:unnamed protein product [Allacma fusca]
MKQETIIIVKRPQDIRRKFANSSCHSFGQHSGEKVPLLEPKFLDVSYKFKMDRNKNIKRSHASLSQFVKSENSNQESKRSKNNLSCELEINETVVAGTAFDNHLILKEIFAYLNPGDLRICCEVSKTWRTIADPMVFEYQIIWSRWRLPLVEVKTTKGYMVPEIQKRSSTIDIEMEFLQNLKRPAFIVMVLNFSNTRSTNESRDGESRDGRAFITRLLRLMPNVEEIHRVPMTMVKEFQDLGKLDVLRSVTFYRQNYGKVLSDCAGMKILVKAKLRFRSLFIGRASNEYLDLSFIRDNKESFEDLLELGKDSIEHFILRPLPPEALIVFPNEMPAVKHIGLWGINNKGLYFEPGEDLSKRFPNVNTISFHHFNKRTWPLSEQWWLPGGMFHSENFRWKIKCLKFCDDSEFSDYRRLLDKFVSVREIVVEVDDDIKRKLTADGVIFPL